MKKGIFRRIFILYAIVLVAAVFLIEIYITAAVRESHINNLRKNLSAQIRLISRDIAFTQAGLDDLSRQLKADTGARVTVIRNDGKVIGDSDTDSSLMDNHLHRTEVEQAALSDSGMVIRYSDTLKHDFLYFAMRISRSEQDTGFVRLAVPLKEVDDSIDSLRIKIILVVAAILLATGLFSIWQTDHLRRLLKQITNFSRSLSRGEIDKRLFLKNAGEFDEIAGNLTEMSEKLQDVIAKNEEEKNRLNVILRSIPDALLIIDSKDIIILSSSASRKFFGDVPVRGMPYVEVVRNHKFFSLMDTVRKSLVPGVSELSLEYPEERHVTVRVSPLFYKEDELAGFIAIFHDITQLKKLEQVRKDFVANVSHEIKTPITAIRGFADTLMDGALEDKENAVKFLQTIKSNSERINSLVDDLMTISKIELGVIRVKKLEVNLEDIFDSVITMLKGRADEKQLYLKTSFRSASVKIAADSERLIQILANLTDNAIKFTESGGVTIGISEEEGSSFLFVEDTGIGIPPKHLQRLGERFYRVDPARSRNMGGTGLGLAIVKHLVKAHGWNMQVESAPGTGTKVKIFL